MLELHLKKFLHTLNNVVCLIRVVFRMQRTTSRESLFSITSDAPCSEIFHLGEQCRINQNRVGTVAFVGTTSFAPGVWVGLILDNPEGKNDGSVSGERYFQCAAKHGVFCRPSKLTKLNPRSMSPTLSIGPPSPTLSIARSIASTTVATNKTRSIYAREFGFDIGERVNIGGGKVGVLKFLDRIGIELFAGVQLDRPLGCCDGVYNGVRYFKCNPLYGIFVKANTVKKCAKLAKPAAIEVRQTKASTLRTWRGSHESLNSAGGISLCSAMSPRFSTKVASSSSSHARDGEIVASLKTCLQEKEAHLERLMKELEQRRAEGEGFTQENNELNARLAELSDSLTTGKREYDDLKNKLHEFEIQCDELNFQLDEAEVHRSVFEAEVIELRAQCSELQDKLQAQRDEVETLHNVVHTSDCATQVELDKEFRPTYTDLYSQTDTQVQVEASVQANFVTSEMGCDACYGEGFNEISSQTTVVETSCIESFSQTEGIEVNTAEIQTENEHSFPRSTMLDTASQTGQYQLHSIVTQTDAIVAPFLVHSTCQTDVEREKKQMSSSKVQTEMNIQHTFSQTNSISTTQQGVQTNQQQTSNLCTQTDSVPQKMSKTSKIQTDPTDTRHFSSQTKSIELITATVQTDALKKNSLAAIQSQTDAAVMCIAQIQTNLSGITSTTPKKSSAQTSPINRLYENSGMQTMPTEPGIVELDVSKLVVTSQSGVAMKMNGSSSEIEAILKKHNEKVEELDSTVSFLNSIISEQNSTINKLRSELSVRADEELSPRTDSQLKTNGTKSSKHLPSYCDHCEAFVHDTYDCLKEVEKREERRIHTVTTPTTTMDKKGRNVARPFCDHCDAFVHNTSECPVISASTPRTKW